MRLSRVRRGSVLIVVMGVLFILALLAITFATLQSIERSIARNYVDGVRAKLLARTGVEFARERLLCALNSGQSGSPQFLKALQYFGTDNLETGTNPALLSVPIEVASNPSLAVEAIGSVTGPLETPQNPTDANTWPRHLWVRTPSGVIAVGSSGIMDHGTYGVNSDFFALKVRDLSGSIYVNDGLNESTIYGSVTKNLRRILNRLGDTVAVTGAGDAIIASRPPTGYRSRAELIGVLGAATYAKIAPFVTTYAWIDKNVPNPVPLSGDGAVLGYYNSWYPGESVGTTMYYRGGLPKVFRYGRGKNATGAVVAGNLTMAPSPTPPASNAHAIYGMDELFPNWIEMTSRAPVNLNAAPKEVLMALLADVHGVWVCERRRDNPPASYGPWYTGAWNTNSNTYDGTSSAPSPATEGDELGFLYTTDPIKSPGLTGPNSASWIADEITACRNRVASPNTGFDYATAPFAGPFRSWRQFYLFCDNLVPIGAVQDTRGSIYYYHGYPAGDRWGYTSGPINTTSWSNTLYNRFASQAIADAIKANFNPNLHLNETNPDENMNLLVDKTDLVVMSTEGCLVPTGYYEIESLGRVVRPLGGSTDALAGTAGNPNELISEFKVEAVIKLYDAVRFTSQQDFYGTGTAGGAATNNYSIVTLPTSLPQTNNGWSLEIGPEPDQGIAPQQCRWDGYIAWPTNYSDLPFGVTKPPGTFSGQDPGATACNSGMGTATPYGGLSTANGFHSSDAGCIMHSHYFRGDYLNHHTEDERRNLNRFAVSGESCEVFPDPTEALPGTYDAQMGPDVTSSSAGNLYRLARDFRVPTASGSGVLPSFVRRAPLDQRIDGLYLERHSTLAYWITFASIGGTLHEEKLLYAYWLKPRYYPETTGKPRQYFNWSRLDPRQDLFNNTVTQWCPPAHHPHQCAHYFCPSQDPARENQSFVLQASGWLQWEDQFVPPFEGSDARYGPIRPSSMIMLGWYSHLSRASFWGGWCDYFATSNSAATPTLNHHLHDSAGYPASVSSPFCAGMPKKRGDPYYVFRNPLASGRWMHYMYYWRSPYRMSQPGTVAQGIDNDEPYRCLLINGIGHRTSGSDGPTTHDTVFAAGWSYTEGILPDNHQDWSYHVYMTADYGGTYDFFDTAANLHPDACAFAPTTYGDRNLIRIGESDRYSTVTGGEPPSLRNFAPDATIDEFYLMRDGSPTGVVGSAQELQRGAMIAMFRKGRFHMPANAIAPGTPALTTGFEGIYDSPLWNLPAVASTVRQLPPPSTLTTPTGYTAVLPPPVPVAGASGGLKMIGVSWTWAAETVDLTSANLDPLLTDYNTQTAASPTMLRPVLEACLFIDSVWYGPYTNDFFSSVTNALGEPVPIVTPTGLRFRFRFSWPLGGAPSTSQFVLASPYIDDITIFYVGSDCGFIEYHAS